MNLDLQIMYLLSQLQLQLEELPKSSKSRFKALETLLNVSTQISDLKRSMGEIEANAVKYARHYGASWDDIGKIYGISRQAAYQKWSS